MTMLAKCRARLSDRLNMNLRSWLGVKHQVSVIQTERVPPPPSESKPPTPLSTNPPMGTRLSDTEDVAIIRAVP